MSDPQIVEAQLERPLRAPSRVVSRCHLALPVVIEVPPILDDGTPFPTRYWLTCPLAHRRVGRLEAAGGVRAMDRRMDADSEFEAGMLAAHERYQAERDAAIPDDHEGPVPTGGVAGGSRGTKCLHAHYADTRVGNDNPVGDLVAPWVEPLDCPIPCVTEVDGEVVRNPKWVEPK